MATRWPWVSILLALLVAVSPLGREVVHNAFFGDDALSRSIAQPFFFMGIAVFVLIAIVESAVRLVILKRRVSRHNDMS